MRFLQAIAIMATASLAAVSADEIILKDGSRVEGVIIMETSSKIAVKREGRTEFIARDKIDSIRKTARDDSSNERRKTGPSKTNLKLGPEFWPPRVNQVYPDLTLYNHHGNVVTLSKIARGRVVILEPIGMTCQACQAFAGGHKYGSFKGVSPQKNIDSIEELLPKYSGGIKLTDPNIVYIQLILYDTDMNAPSVESIREWAQHYRIASRPNTYVLAGTPDMVGKASYQMIPGFQVINRNFILVGDGTGHKPRHDIWRQVFPNLPNLVRR